MPIDTDKINPLSEPGLKSIQDFIALADKVGWHDYLYRGALNLKLIGKLTTVGRSALYNNPAIVSAISDKAEILLEQKIITRLPYVTEKKNSSLPVESTENKELRELRKENRSLILKIQELEARLDEKQKVIDEFKLTQEHLFFCGRIIR